jgi:N-acetyl-anhydromuramyl-L-alanine amidase AmpD
MSEVQRFFDKLKDLFGSQRMYIPYRDPYYTEVENSGLDGKFKLSYPPAAQSRKMVTKGKYRYGFPEGAVIHYNAGRFEPKQFLNYMRGMKYVTFLIDRQGHVWQDFPLDEWGHHAGMSSWGGFEGTVHDCFVGIELMSAGVLTKTLHGKFKSWFNTEINPEEVRNYKGEYYHCYTPEQESQLTDLLLWLENNGKGVFKFENVVGHHEVSPKRKKDPGGALSMMMDDYRTFLKNTKIERIQEQT